MRCGEALARKIVEYAQPDADPIQKEVLVLFCKNISTPINDQRAYDAILILAKGNPDA